MNINDRNNVTDNNDDRSQFSGFSFSDPSVPIRRYFSRRHSSQIHTKDLPFEKSEHGVYTPAGILFVAIKLTVPLAYTYIVLILIAELCAKFPITINAPIDYYFPRFAFLMDRIHNSSTPFLDSWAILEATFYIFLIIKLQWLQYKCPLEASLSSAPLLELQERQLLWNRIMKCEKDDPISFITGWFFDESLENISRYDVRDFIAWSMFDGRNQEHLTSDEVRQLSSFMNEIEKRIALHLYGPNDTSIQKENNSSLTDSRIEIELTPQIDRFHKDIQNEHAKINSTHASDESLSSQESLDLSSKEIYSFQIVDLPEPKKGKYAFPKKKILLLILNFIFLSDVINLRHLYKKKHFDFIHHKMKHIHPFLPIFMKITKINMSNIKKYSKIQNFIPSKTFEISSIHKKSMLKKMRWQPQHRYTKMLVTYMRMQLNYMNKHITIL